MSEHPQFQLLIGDPLRARKWTLATAESCTGGLIGSLITDVPGSSDYFVGGILAYSNTIKQSLLGVRAETLARHGAVSAQTAAEMAEGARRVLAADVALSATGIAGPGGGTPDKPVGLVWIGLATPAGTSTHRFVWAGDRATNKQLSAEAALRLLVEHLQQPEPTPIPSRRPPLREPAEVEAAFSTDGKALVRAFTWKSRKLPVVSQGRQSANADGIRVLVMSTRERVYELWFERASARWFVIRASEDRLSA
jgi:PncC family amidohydrolase